MRVILQIQSPSFAFDQALQLNGSCGASYVLMADIFAASGMQEDAEKAEAMRLKYADQKKSKNTMHGFNSNTWGYQTF